MWTAPSKSLPAVALRRRATILATKRAPLTSASFGSSAQPLGRSYKRPVVGTVVDRDSDVRQRLWLGGRLGLPSLSGRAAAEVLCVTYSAGAHSAIRTLECNHMVVRSMRGKGKQRRKVLHSRLPTFQKASHSLGHLHCACGLLS